MTGTVVGGWEFVITAYAATFLALGAYSYSVIHRYSRERRRASPERRS